MLSLSHNTGDLATVHKIIHSWRGNFPPELIHLLITVKVRILYLAIPKIPCTVLISFTHQIIFNFHLHFQSILHGIQSALKAPDNGFIIWINKLSFSVFIPLMHVLAWTFRTAVLNEIFPPMEFTLSATFLPG